MTPKQKKLLEYVKTRIGRQGFCPSQKEIADHFGFRSLGTVQNYLVRLEREGHIDRQWNARRGLRPIATLPPNQGSTQNFVQTLGSANFSVPLLGSVAAGRPIEAIEGRDQLLIPPLPEGHFALQVVGDSMIEDGILDHDYVIVKSQADARNGQTVVAVVGTEATVKRYKKFSDRVELHPANSRYQPIVISSGMAQSKGFQIKGIVIGVWRALG